MQYIGFRQKRHGISEFLGEYVYGLILINFENKCYGNIFMTRAISVCPDPGYICGNTECTCILEHNLKNYEEILDEKDSTETFNNIVDVFNHCEDPNECDYWERGKNSIWEKNFLNRKLLVGAKWLKTLDYYKLSICKIIKIQRWFREILYSPDTKLGYNKVKEIGTEFLQLQEQLQKQLT